MREIAALYYLIAAICTLGLVSVSMRPSKESRGSLLAGLLLATGPLAQLALFADPFAYIRGDFAQHAAYAAQYADGLRHFELPRIVHSSAIVGDIEPLYYGRLLYLWSGALSTVFGGLMAMKLAGLIVLTIQIAACYRVFLALRVAPVAAACLAVISSVTVYQFNNAIVRGGITEFIATSLLFVAACQMLLLFIRGDRPILRGVAFGLTWGLVTQTHPITALNGSVALGIIGAYLTLYSRQWRLAAGFGVIAAVVIILIAAPWLYINLAEPSSYSNSGNTLPAFKLKHWAAIDDFWLRLSPLPWYRAQVDFRESYFVTQCNSVLLLAYFGRRVARAAALAVNLLHRRGAHLPDRVNVHDTRLCNAAPACRHAVRLSAGNLRQLVPVRCLRSGADAR